MGGIVEWRAWSTKVAWMCIAVYLYIGFIAYPARRSGGQWLFLDGAPGWVVGLALVCFFGSWVLFAVGDSPSTSVMAPERADGDDSSD